MLLPLAVDSTAARTGIASLLVGVAAAIALRAAAFLWRGYTIRARFRQLEAQGIPLPAPYSFWLGHIPLLVALRRGLPRNASDTYLRRRLVLEWRTHFPRAAACPAVIYLDVWPLLAEPVAIVNDADLVQRVVQHRHPPRHPTAKYLQRFVSGDRNLTAWDGAVHKLWRARLNPGFAPRNLQAFVPELLHHVSVFAARLRERARGDDDGGDGAAAWGPVFPLLPLAIDLTFDVICTIVLDFSPGEQTHGPTVFQQSFTALSRHQLVPSLRNLPTRLNPLWHLEERRCHRALRALLLPHIRRLAREQEQEQEQQQQQHQQRKTVVKMTLQQIHAEAPPKPGPRPASTLPRDTEEDMLGLTKQFIMAGRVTTAITLCFTLHHVHRDAAVLARLRAEHDAVLGADARAALAAAPPLLHALPYTLAVIKETLRLHPLASNVRRGSPAVVLRHRGVEYPTAGCVLVPGIETLHYRPDLWPRVSEFVPERWVVPEGHALYPGPAARRAWRPFEQGPMACIGLELALMELKLALALTVRELDVECAWDEWDAQRGNVGAKTDLVNGSRVYQTNATIGGPPTDNLPIRVRLRRKPHDGQ